MPRHIVITAAGTFADMFDTTPPQPAAVAAALVALNSNKYFWQPLGNYPASVTNPEMQTSVNMGVAEIARLLNQVYSPGNPIGDTIILLGWSQGAWVVSSFMQQIDKLCPGRRKDIVCVAVWGNPVRLPGWASGNQFAGWPMPADRDGAITCGVGGPLCLKPADVAPPDKNRRHYWGEFVNTPGDASGGKIDLYAENPGGPPSGSPAGLQIDTTGPPWSSEPAPGMYETQVFDLVVHTSIGSLFAFVWDVFKLFGPGLFGHVLGIAEAVWNGGMFAVKGSGAAHFTYDIGPIIAFVNLAGTETPPR